VEHASFSRGLHVLAIYVHGMLYDYHTAYLSLRDDLDGISVLGFITFFCSSPITAYDIGRGQSLGPAPQVFAACNITSQHQM